MKRILVVLALVSCLWVFGAGMVLADSATLNLLTLDGVPKYGGDFVGPVQGTLNGGPAIGFVCDDFSTTTYVPSSFTVNVSTLTLADLANTKFGTRENALYKYQEVAWLRTQMETNPTEIGPIQFAIWKIFDPDTPTVTGQSEWLTAAASIDLRAVDFSSMRIYTATDTTNQEFISGLDGVPPHLPIPPSLALLAPGLLGLVGLRKKFAR